MTRTIDRRRDMGGGKATLKSERDRATVGGGGAVRATGTEHLSSAWTATGGLRSRTHARLVGFMSRRPPTPAYPTLACESAASRRPVARNARGGGSQTASPLAAPVSPTQQSFPAVVFHAPREKGTMHADRDEERQEDKRHTRSLPTAGARRIRRGVPTAFAHRHTSATCHPRLLSPFGRRTAGERIGKSDYTGRRSLAIPLPRTRRPQLSSVELTAHRVRSKRASSSWRTMMPTCFWLRFCLP